MAPAPFHLEPPFDQPGFAAALLPLFTQSRPRALSLPNAFATGAASRLRKLARNQLSAQTLADRGRYQFVDLVGTANIGMQTICAPLLAGMQRFAEAVSGLKLAKPVARIVFLRPGDYALRLDDALLRMAPRALELSLDLSPAPGDAASVVYSEDLFTHRAIAQLPGQISLVERGPMSTRCDRYRSCLMGRREFVLLRATFPLAES